MSASPSSRMPSASLASDAPLGRPGDRWRIPRLVLLGVWAALFVVAIALWVVDALPKGPTGKILRREVHPPSE